MGMKDPLFARSSASHPWIDISCTSASILKPFRICIDFCFGKSQSAIGRSLLYSHFHGLIMQALTQRPHAGVCNPVAHFNMWIPPWHIKRIDGLLSSFEGAQWDNKAMPRTQMTPESIMIGNWLFPRLGCMATPSLRRPSSPVLAFFWAISNRCRADLNTRIALLLICTKANPTNTSGCLCQRQCQFLL